MIHTHNKIVESKVVLGQMKNRIYDLEYVQSDGQPIYEVAYYGDKFSHHASNVLERTNARAEAILRDEEMLSVGDVYRVEADTFHEAVVSEDVETATVVCMHTCAQVPSKVLGLADYPDKIVFQRVGVPVEVLLLAIRALSNV